MRRLVFGLMFLIAALPAMAGEKKPKPGTKATKPQSDREVFEHKLSVMRRTILTLDIAALSAGSYFLGKTLAT